MRFIHDYLGASKTLTRHGRKTTKELKLHSKSSLIQEILLRTMYSLIELPMGV